MIKTLKEKYFSDRVLLGEWILAIATGLLVFAATSYVDLQSLTVWSTNVWDVTLDSNIRHLYEYSALNVYELSHKYLGSELMSVLPWSIWNLPIWFIQRFWDIPIINSPIMLAYSKLFLVALSVIMLIFTNKITFMLTGDKNRSMWAAFLSGSSIYLYVSVCYSGQNDIIMITLSVISIYFLLKGKGKTFLILSATAIAIKPFYILPFLAVLLLAEKNILKVLLKTVAGVSGVILQKLLFTGAPMYSESMKSGPAQSMLEEMFPGNLSTSFGSVSFFAISLILIYFYSYTRDFNKKSVTENTVQYGKYVIYIITVTYFSYVMFSPYSYYRLAILLPYLYIVLVQNKKIYLYNLMLDTAMSLSILIKIILRGSKIFWLRFVNKSIFQSLLGYEVDYKNAGYYANLNLFLFRKFPLLEFLQPLFAGIAFICGILLIVLNHPSEKIKLPLDADRNSRVLCWARAVIIVPFILLTLLLFTTTSARIY